MLLFSSSSIGGTPGQHFSHDLNIPHIYALPQRSALCPRLFNTNTSSSSYRTILSLYSLLMTLSSVRSGRHLTWLGTPTPFRFLFKSNPVTPRSQNISLTCSQNKIGPNNNESPYPFQGKLFTGRGKSPDNPTWCADDDRPGKPYTGSGRTAAGLRRYHEPQGGALKEDQAGRTTIIRARCEAHRCKREPPPEWGLNERSPVRQNLFDTSHNTVRGPHNSDPSEGSGEPPRKEQSSVGLRPQ